MNPLQELLSNLASNNINKLTITFDTGKLQMETNFECSETGVSLSFVTTAHRRNHPKIFTEDFERQLINSNREFVKFRKAIQKSKE